MSEVDSTSTTAYTYGRWIKSIGYTNPWLSLHSNRWGTPQKAHQFAQEAHKITGETYNVYRVTVTAIKVELEE